MKNSKKLGYEAIYGDTDSLMIWTREKDHQKALSVGSQIMELVNKNTKILKIKVDSVYKKLILCAKKKYVGFEYSDKYNWKSELVVNSKGLELERSDWWLFSK